MHVITALNQLYFRIVSPRRNPMFYVTITISNSNRLTVVVYQHRTDCRTTLCTRPPRKGLPLREAQNSFHCWEKEFTRIIQSAPLRNYISTRSNGRTMVYIQRSVFEGKNLLQSLRILRSGLKMR